MRKFRVWDKLTNKMHTGNTGFHLFSNGALGFNSGHDYEVVDSNNFEVLFYTGLKDKDGKEIYEGDRVKRPSSNGTPEQMAYGSIKENKGCYYIDFGGGYWTHGLLLYHFAQCEIIGNIYESPELLNPLNKQS